MRIAIVNWSTRKVGGAETYLDMVLPALRRRGHDLAMFCETDAPANRSRIAFPPGTPVFCADANRAGSALAQLAEWKPEVLYAHGLANAAVESQILGIAPAVLFVHGYAGTCISGEKAFKLPERRPCSRRFGWRCLMHYYPRRCGGLSPATMWKLYRFEARRLRLLSHYQAIITASQYMRQELIRHGLPPRMIHAIQPPIAVDDAPSHQAPACRVSSSASLLPPGGPANAWRLLFAGRMTDLKGGSFMLAALPRIAAALGCPLKALFVGDGPARAAWEDQARRVRSRNRTVDVEFAGWLHGDALDAAIDSCHLLLMPSVWPEPFGRSGPEAGLRGVPTVAFAVGGIPEWLLDGVNGHLVPAHPPTVSGLADAVVKALADPVHHQRLRSGARALAMGFSLSSHLARLCEILAAVTAIGARAIGVA